MSYVRMGIIIICLPFLQLYTHVCNVLFCDTELPLLTSPMREVIAGTLDPATSTKGNNQIHTIMCNPGFERLHRFELALMPVLSLIYNTTETHEPVKFTMLMCLGNEREDVFHKIHEKKVTPNEQSTFNVGATEWVEYAVVKVPNLLGFDKNNERVTFVCNTIAHQFQRQVS